RVRDCKFSCDGTRVVFSMDSPIGRDRSIIEAGDVERGSRLFCLDTPVWGADVFTFSGDGRTVLVGQRDGAVRLVECVTGSDRLMFQNKEVVTHGALDANSTRSLATSADAPAYVWDLLPSPGKWDSSRADELWFALSIDDAKRAYAAIKLLRTNPAEAIPFLKSRMKLAKMPPADHVTTLLTRLDAA